MRNPNPPLEYCCSVASIMHSVLEVDSNLSLKELLFHVGYVLDLQHKHYTYRFSVDWFDNSEFYF